MQILTCWSEGGGGEEEQQNTGRLDPRPVPDRDLPRGAPLWHRCWIAHAIFLGTFIVRVYQGEIGPNTAVMNRGSGILPSNPYGRKPSCIIPRWLQIARSQHYLQASLHPGVQRSPFELDTFLAPIFSYCSECAYFSALFRDETCLADSFWRKLSLLSHVSHSFSVYGLSLPESTVAWFLFQTSFILSSSRLSLGFLNLFLLFFSNFRRAFFSISKFFFFLPPGF